MEVDNNLHQLSGLWLKIEKHQKRNQNLTNKQAKLYAQFQARAAPAEQKQAELLQEQIEHLIGFIARKTLTHPERDELLGWISSDIEYLESHPFIENIDTQALRSSMGAAISKFAKEENISADEESLCQLEAMLEEMFDGALQLSREELEEVANDPAQLEKHIKALHERMQDEEIDTSDIGFDEEDLEFEQDFFHRQQDYYQEHQDYLQEQLKGFDRLFKGSQLNKLYKRLAAKLHPDKESDPGQKVIKQALMKELATARKNKDVFTMLQLYSQHFEDDLFDFDEDTLTVVTSLLGHKVKQLNAEYRDLKDNHSPESIIWKNFKGRSQKITDQNIQEHIKQLHKECDEITVFLAENKTVKKIKSRLQERLRSHKSFPFANFDEALAEVFSAPF